jgi:RNA polymerase sigma-70 factor (ECF subfamily)
MSAATALMMDNSKATQEFDKIFHQYYPLIYRTAYRITGISEDAEDIVQSVFLRILRSGLPAGFDENPKAYLYRAAVNAGLNVVRSRRHHVLSADPEASAVFDNPNSPNARSPIHGLLIEAIAKLEPHVVEMLLLRYEHDYSDAEIAKLLGKSRGVVAVTLYRARARLKKLLRSSLGEKS